MIYHTKYCDVEELSVAEDMLKIGMLLMNTVIASANKMKNMKLLFSKGQVKNTDISLQVLFLQQAAGS